MLERADLKQLRLPLAAALLLAGVGIAALLFSEHKLAEARKLQKAGQDRLAAVRGRLAKVSEEELEIRNNLVQFKQFTDKGMTGEEKRLEWIENLAEIRQRRRLFEVRYNLERQRAVDYPGIPPNQKGSEAIFLANRMNLDLQLLHEGDLLNFLADLGATSQTFPALRSCTMARIEGAAGGGGPLRPRMHAACVVDMITLRAPDKSS